MIVITMTFAQISAAAARFSGGFLFYALDGSGNVRHVSMYATSPAGLSDPVAIEMDGDTAQSTFVVALATAGVTCYEATRVSE